MNQKKYDLNLSGRRDESALWEQNRSEVLRNLREVLRQKNAEHRDESSRLKIPTGIEKVDRMLHGGVPRGGLTMVTGAWATGKTSLALLPLIWASRELYPAAIIDVAGCVYPPVLARLGAELERVLFVRSGPQKAVWAAEQILRSGVFHVVVLIDSMPGHRSSGVKLNIAALRRLQLASEVTNAIMLVVHAEKVAAGLSSVCIQVDSPSGTNPSRVGPASSRFIGSNRLARVSVFRGARSGSALVEL